VNSYGMFFVSEICGRTFCNNFQTSGLGRMHHRRSNLSGGSLPRYYTMV
jgi:hypothetical protein